MSKILILGGHGFIGCHTSNILKQKKHEVGIIDCYHQYFTFPDWEYQPVLAQRKVMFYSTASVNYATIYETVCIV